MLPLQMKKRSSDGQPVGAGSFASGGIPDHQAINLHCGILMQIGLVAADPDTLVSHVIADFEGSTGFSNGLFVMTTTPSVSFGLFRFSAVSVQCFQYSRCSSPSVLVQKPFTK